MRSLKSECLDRVIFFGEPSESSASTFTTNATTRDSGTE